MAGKAYLVGAGPGDPDLITVRGLKLLRKADVVVYDRLAPPELLDEARENAELLYVGKEPGNHSLTQQEIDELLVSHVREGKQVVRLKGGDPFIFGRGGEEALALAEAGLPCEVVPGISAALAVPAAAGIPLTHRGIASSFAVVSGRSAMNTDGGQNDWEALARVPTLVVLMGVTNARSVQSKLLDAGRSPQTLTAIVQDGTTEKQRTIVTTLSQLAQTIQERGVHAPAAIILGDVVELSCKLHGTCTD